MKKLLSIVALLLLLTLSSRAHAAEYVLSGSGVFSCNDISHAQPGFPVESFSLSGADTLIGSDTGSSSGKLSLSNFTVHRNFDGCSEALMRAFLGRMRTPTLVFKAFRSVDGKPSVFLTIKLFNVYVSNYQLQGVSDGSNPTEAVSFHFDSVQIESININRDGTPGPSVTVTYDLGTNTVS